VLVSSRLLLGKRNAIPRPTIGYFGLAAHPTTVAALRFATTLVQRCEGDLGELNLLNIDGASYIELANLGFRQDIEPPARNRRLFFLRGGMSIQLTLFMAKL